MTRRRQWGRVRRLSSGRYQARLPDGTPAPATFAAKAEATRWLAAAETDFLRGTFVHPALAGNNVTVADWLREYQQAYSIHKRPTTRARDRYAIERHIKPRLGHVPLARLRPADVQAFVADLRLELGPGTTRTVYGVLRAALHAAVNAEMVARSPTRGIRLPAKPKTEVIILQPTELHRLAQATEAPWRPMFISPAPADCASRRLPACGQGGSTSTATASMSWKRRPRSANEVNPNRMPDGEAFPWPRSSPRWWPNISVGWGWAPTPMRSCFLRYGAGACTRPTGTSGSGLPREPLPGWASCGSTTSATARCPLWVAMGANLLQVGRWLGHSTVQITADVYGHLFPETIEAVVARLDQELRTSLPSPPPEPA